MTDLMKKLYERCDREFDEFLDEANEAYEERESSRTYPPRCLEYGDEFLTEYAYDYIVLGDIMVALEDAELTDEECEALLKKPSPLYAIYDEIREIEAEYMDAIRVCIETAANKKREETRK